MNLQILSSFPAGSHSTILIFASRVAITFARICIHMWEAAINENYLITEFYRRVFIGWQNCTQVEVKIQESLDSKGESINQTGRPYKDPTIFIQQ